MRLCIDTNAYRSVTEGDPFCVSAIQMAGTLAFSPIVLGELRAGFKFGKQETRNEDTLQSALARKRVITLEINSSTSIIYASIWAELKKKGRPIPTNDMWIAAQCVEYDLVLLTKDAHFQDVSGLKLFGRGLMG